MTAKINAAINDIIGLAKQAPQKYCRVYWRADNKMLVIKDTRIHITKALLIYQNGTQRVMFNASDNTTNFTILCRPKKHMVFMMKDEERGSSAKLFNLNSEVAENVDGQPYDNNSEVFACVFESPTQETVILSYTNGIYFLQTYDSEYSVTLHGVITAICGINDESRKEACLNEQKEEQDVTGLLGIV